MNIKRLIVLIGAFTIMPQAVALAQQEVIAQQDMIAHTGSLIADALVNVSFGAVMMQVPVSLAVQLCPGADADEMAAQYAAAGEVACTIPHEAYTSHSGDPDSSAR